MRDNAAELAKERARREAAAEHQELLAAAVHRKRSADAQELRAASTSPRSP